MTPLDGGMTAFDAALYFFLVMFAVLVFCAAFDWWLARYDYSVSRMSDQLRGDRRELLDLFDQERELAPDTRRPMGPDDDIARNLRPAASGVHVERRSAAR